jgi:arginine/serine-rich splicing factor 4/5/6
LIVENVSSRTSWPELKDFFSQFGEVAFANVHETREGEGVIEFTNRRDLKKALEKRGELKLHGKNIVIYED